MLFGTHQNNFPRLELGGSEVEIVGEFKYLGFHMDRRLVHKYHIDHLCSKLRRLFFVARNLKYKLNERAALAFYNGLVRSSLNYGLLVWGGAVTARMRKLERTQRRIIISLLGHHNREMSELQILKKYGILPLREL